MTVTNNFSDQVFDYIRNQYGKNTLKMVQSDTNKNTVSKLLTVAENQNDDVTHTANKIIAMLRMNP